MRTLYQKCKLVHGDLSEYNILYFEGYLYIIDVSQAVDLDHPHALDFLKEDCAHVSDFFKKHGVAVMTIRELFDFIVDPTITEDLMESYLEEVQRKIMVRGDISMADEIADSVFRQSYIPKSLHAVEKAEEDVMKITTGKDTGDILYQTITGLKDALPKVAQSATPRTEQQSLLQPGSEGLGDVLPAADGLLDDADSAAGSDSDEDNSEEGQSDEENGGSHRHESDEENGGSHRHESDEENGGSHGQELGPADKKAARKENKKKVKEEKREARKNKIPKALKKRKKKLAKSQKTR